MSLTKLNSTPPAASYLIDENVHATTLLAILVDRYGLSEIVEWEPDTLILQVKDDFKVDIPSTNRDKIWALVTALSTDLFYNSPEAFMHICSALSGDGANIQVLEPPDPEELAWGVTEIIINDSDNLSPDPNMFSTEVRRFIGVVLDYHNIDDPPDVLSSLALVSRPASNEILLAEDDPDIIGAVFNKNKIAADDIRAHNYKPNTAFKRNSFYTAYE